MSAYPVRNLHVEERGSGPLLLCLHGIGSSSASFAPQLEGLADRYRVAVWDAPGYGRSPDPIHPIDMSGYADLAASLIEDVLGPPAVLLGVSWGGVIATRVALKRPDLLRGLILVSASAGSGVDAARAAAMRARPEMLGTLGARAYARRRTPSLFSPDADPQVIEVAEDIMATSLRVPGFTYATASMAATDHVDQLPNISLPTLVVVGERDEVTGSSAAGVFMRSIPAARLEVIPGAGHLVNQEAPEQFNATVADWIDGLSAPTSAATTTMEDL